MPVQHRPNGELDRRFQRNRCCFQIAHLQNIHAVPFISDPEGDPSKLRMDGNFDSFAKLGRRHFPDDNSFLKTFPSFITNPILSSTLIFAIGSPFTATTSAYAP